MKILYYTDLHGDIYKYNKVLKIIESIDLDVVIDSGDMLPKGLATIVQSQKEFMEEFLKTYLSKLEKRKIHFLGMLGNDDRKVYDSLFDNICNGTEYIHNIAQKKVSINGYDFIGMNLVVDYPFRLKDRCRRDTSDYVLGRQLGTGLLSADQSGKHKVIEWEALAYQLPTLEEELEKLPESSTPEKTIYVIHMPPQNCGLDMLGSGQPSGSKAVYNFIKKTQPLMSMHGHIHESPRVSGVWQASIGKTICIQPGQMSSQLCYVVINLETMEIERKIF